MKKIFFILLMLSTSCFAQNRVASYNNATFTFTGFQSVTLSDIGNNAFSLSVSNAATSTASLAIAFAAADTTPAVGGLAKFAILPPGSTLNLPNRSESKVWIKLTGSGNGNIQIIKY